MKGVVLAGGTGSRLHPLTRITNKHLLPVFDKPMVYYPIQTLVNAGIQEILLVTGGKNAGEFLRLLGNGHEFGIERLFYAYQEKAGGIAEALGLAEKFVAGERCVVMLADNVFERSLALDEMLREAERLGDPARLLLVGVEEPVTAARLAVPEQAQELARMRPTGDDHDLDDARADERLDRPLDHRSIEDRQQVLVRDARQRVETRPRAAGQDDAFHGPDSTSGQARLRSERAR